MRYAHGIIIGATLPGVIFMVAAAIKITGLTADAAGHIILWEIYTLWFVTSIALSLILPLIIFFLRRDVYRQFLIFEAGGFGLFGPLWLFFFTDISGDPWYSILINGINDGLIGFSPSGTVEGIAIGSSILIPFLFASIVFGLIFLRPSFILKHGSNEKATKPTTGEKPSEASDEESLDVDMPDVSAPTPTVDSVTNLREALIDLNIQEPTINLILNAGIGTITDLVATSAEQLSAISKLDKHEAENLLIAIQKKQWFSSI